MGINIIRFLDLQYQNSQVSEAIFSKLKTLVKNNSFILGEDLTIFENKFSDLIGVKYCISVSNGTDAIEVAIRSLNLPKNSEIIVPANSFIASAIGVIKSNHKLVLADIDSENLLLGVKQIQEKLTKRTRVIMPVHLYGQCAPMTEIMKFANDNNLMVIEDLAQAQGSEHFGKKAGSWGVINATSFYPGKNLGAWGDAGAVLTDREDLQILSRKIRNYGSEIKYKHDLLGFNYRMDNIQAVVLNEKLKYLETWNKERQNKAKIYLEKLGLCQNIVIPKVVNGNNHIYHLFVILAENRDGLQNFLQINGIETMVHYPIPIHKQEYMKNEFKKLSLKNAEIASNKLLSLPLYPGLPVSDIEYISDKILEYYSK